MDAKEWQGSYWSGLFIMDRRVPAYHPCVIRAGDSYLWTIKTRDGRRCVRWVMVCGGGVGTVFLHLCHGAGDFAFLVFYIGEFLLFVRPGWDTDATFFYLILFVVVFFVTYSM